MGGTQNAIHIYMNTNRTSDGKYTVSDEKLCKCGHAAGAHAVMMVNGRCKANGALGGCLNGTGLDAEYETAADFERGECECVKFKAKR